MKRIMLGAAVAALAAVPAAAGAAEGGCRLEKLAELPVTMTAAMKPMVSAQINGMDVKFIADSGAFYSLISPGIATAAKLHLRPMPPGFHLGGIGGETNSFITTVSTFTLAGYPFRGVNFLVGGSDTGAAGLLGQNVLALAGDVEYDLPHGMIRLFRSRGCGDRPLAYWATDGAYSTIKIEPLATARFHTVGTVSVNGQTLRAMFDTGAGSTAISRKAAERLGVRTDGPGVQPAPPSRGLGREIVRAWTAPFASLKLGNEEVHNVRLRIVDTEFSQSDMLIGADFLIAHRVYVDNTAHRLFISYTGGRMFGLPARVEGEAAASAPAAAAEGAAPTDAEGFARRGAILLAQRDVPGAIADFTKAIELAPREPRFLLQRAEAYARSGRRALAAADFNRAAEIDPQNVPARIARAQMRARTGERDAALADLDAAAAAVVGAVNERLPLASEYATLGAYDKAVGQYDVWIKAHPEDSRLPDALNGRCWARALAGTGLQQALGDCSAALRRRPRTALYLDSRGIVRLRLGDYDGAIADFDAALQANPKMAWSLYGRGLARRHKGLTAEAEADLKAAAAIQPAIAERARRAGIE